MIGAVARLLMDEIYVDDGGVIVGSPVLVMTIGFPHFGPCFS